MIWRQVKLGELVDNFSVRAKDVGGSDGLDFFGVSNEDGIIKTKYAAEDKAEDYKIIEKGCFAYNPYRVNVGSIGLVSDETRGLISPAYVVFKPKPKSIIPELLFKFLKSDEGLRQIIFYARGTVRQALRFEDLCNIEISIPEYKDQSSLYLKLINSQEKSNLLGAELQNQLTLIKKLRQQLLQDAVQGKLVPQKKSRKFSGEPASELLKKIKAEKAKLIAEKKLKKEKELPPIKPEEIPFEIPENWVWCRLGELIDIERPLTYGIVKMGSEPKTDGIYALRCSDIRFRRIDLSNVRKVTKELSLQYGRTVLKGNEILLNVRGTLGGCALTSATHMGFNIAREISMIVLQDKGLNNYILNVLTSPYFTMEINKNLRGIAYKGLNLNLLNNFLIPLPPLAEQTRIVQKLDELMKCCDDLETSIKESQATNEKLLQQVLREALRGDSDKNELSEIGIDSEPKSLKKRKNK